MAIRVLTPVSLLYSFVYRFNKLFCSPRAGGGAPAAVVIQRWPRRLHLLERAALLLQILNPVANDVNHVAIVCNIADITDAAAAGDDDRASLCAKFGICDVQNLRQS